MSATLLLIFLLYYIPISEQASYLIVDSFESSNDSLIVSLSLNETGDTMIEGRPIIPESLAKQALVVLIEVLDLEQNETIYNFASKYDVHIPILPAPPLQYRIGNLQPESLYGATLKLRSPDLSYTILKLVKSGRWYRNQSGIVEASEVVQVKPHYSKDQSKMRITVQPKELMLSKVISLTGMITVTYDDLQAQIARIIVPKSKKGAAILFPARVLRSDSSRWQTSVDAPGSMQRYYHTINKTNQTVSLITNKSGGGSQGSGNITFITSFSLMTTSTMGPQQPAYDVGGETVGVRSVCAIFFAGIYSTDQSCLVLNTLDLTGANFKSNEYDDPSQNIGALQAPSMYATLLLIVLNFLIRNRE